MNDWATLIFRGIGIVALMLHDFVRYRINGKNPPPRKKRA